MNPPAQGTIRTLSESLTLENVAVSIGTNVLVSGYAMHNNPRVWTNPRVFDPDRFTKEAEFARPKAAYFPFSYGPRECIGKGMAEYESVIVLSSLLKRYTFKLNVPPNWKFSTEFAVTTRPKYDVPLVVSLRTS